MVGHLPVKASCHKLHEVLSRLNGPVRDLFSTTSFGYLLDLPAQSEDRLLIHGLLLHMWHPTAERDAVERLYFRFTRRTLSFGPEEFCLVIELYMDRCHKSRIEFSTMYKHGYGENKFRSRVFPYHIDTSLIVQDLEPLILNQRFNDISAQDGVRAILLYILNQGSRGGLIYGLKHTLNCRVCLKNLRIICPTIQQKRLCTHYQIWIWKMFPAIRGNDVIQRYDLYPRRGASTEKKMIASDAKTSTPHYLSYITSLNCESSEVPSSGRYNFKNDVASSLKTSCGNNQSSKSTERTYTVEINKNTAREIMAILESLEDEIRGLKNKGGIRDGDYLELFFSEGNENVVYSPQKSNRVNDDNDVGNPPEYDSRKQIKNEKKKKKKVVASDIVDAENHLPRPHVVKEGRPWAGSAMGNPFDSLDGCKSWLEVDRRFEELMERILLEIGYWNHMGLPVQKASITVTDVTDVPQ
uniref:Uncharacterized protein n=1 Tax=Lactuca sativa TaxID=4236 RepID=A0A9R1UV15_LACSA|nr:hypothetical protein LSAT_V11C800450970 [Lactuca sativa]